MKLEERIKEIALNVAPDYPDIEKCDSIEQCWAIEQTFQGILAANQDCHDEIRNLKEQIRCFIAMKEGVGIRIAALENENKQLRKELRMAGF